MILRAIIQARMGSTRLPGKVLMPLAGGTVLGRLVERVRCAVELDGILVATSVKAQDDPVAGECARLGVACHRGSEQDVLRRFREALDGYGADGLVRITADCPLYDPWLLDELLRRFRAANSAGVTVDYLTNCTLKRTYPRGLDTEILTAAALRTADAEAVDPYEREHVTPFIYRRPDRFRLCSHEADADRSDHRWVLDTAADWEFVKRVYEALYRPGRVFRSDDVFALLRERPEWKNIDGPAGLAGG